MTKNKITPAFIELVERMRAAQKEYFKNREIAALKISKELERQVDYMIAHKDQYELF